MKQLQDYMKTHSDDSGPLLPALPVLEPKAPIAGADDDDEIAWEEPPALPPPAPTELDNSDANADSESHHTPDSPSAIVAVAADADNEDADPDDNEIAQEVIPSEIVPISGDWPREVEGVALQTRSGRKGGTNNYNTRLGVQCPCCIFKSRSTALLQNELGPMAPVIFLGTWLTTMGHANHRDHKPSLSDMQAYKALHFPD